MSKIDRIILKALRQRVVWMAAGSKDRRYHSRPYCHRQNVTHLPTLRRFAERAGVQPCSFCVEGRR